MMATIDAEVVEPQEYAIKLRDMDSLGKTTEYSLPVPDNGDFNAWSLMQQVAMLKEGAFKQTPIPGIIYAIAYANRMGLDIMAGDVYVAAGRIATTNKAKIKMALATGNIEGIEANIEQLDEPLPQAVAAKCIVKKDLECTVIIHVKGWKTPIITKQRLSRWFKNSTQWQENPEHMLRLNSIAHACELVHPTATEADELPEGA